VPTTSPNKRTLLYVDDDDTLVLMKEVFSSEDYSIVTKPSGEDGLEFIKENGAVTVVVSDFIMKGMNGLEFLRLVKAHSPTSKLCLCSGSFDRRTLMDKVKDQEIDGFIMKPVFIEQLLSTVSDLMEASEI
jgi:DNA-binding NtrC family response regulator